MKIILIWLVAAVYISIAGCSMVPGLQTPVVQVKKEFKTSETIEKGIEKKGFEEVFINFDYNKYTIRESELPQIDELAKAIKTVARNNDQVYLLIGHTDSTGSDEYNLDLSLSRSDAVKETLVGQYNVSREILFTEGRGESELLVDPEQSPEDQELNRRVQVVLLSRNELSSRKASAQTPISNTTRAFNPTKKSGDAVSYSKTISVESDNCIRIPFMGEVCTPVGFRYKINGRVVGIDKARGAYRVKVSSVSLTHRPLAGNRFMPEAEHKAQNLVGSVVSVKAKKIE